MKSFATMILLSGVMVFSFGCASPIKRIAHSSPTPLYDEPLTVDAAMELRDWQRSTAYYASGDTIAGPTGFVYEPAYDLPEWEYPIIEPLLFVGQTIALPVSYIFTPPWSQQRYAGGTYDTSYSVMPMLPSGPRVSPEVLPDPIEPGVMPTDR